MLERLRSALTDRYTLERELGHGGNATVYLAHDTKHDRKVALKVLAPRARASVAPPVRRTIAGGAGLTRPPPPTNFVSSTVSP